MAKMRLAKTIEDADAYWAAMTPEQQAAVEEFHGNGASPVHAVNMAITGVTQKMDAARLGTDASESLDPGDSPEMFSDAPGDSRESAIPDVDVPGFGNLRQLSPGEDPFASKAERVGAGGLALANDVSMDIVPMVKKIAAHPIAASGKLAASMIAGGPLGPALFQTAMHNTDADPESAEVLAEKDAPGATGSGRLAGDAVNAAMAGAAGPEMARAGSSALEALKSKVGGIKRVGGIVAKSAAEEMGKKVIGRKGMAMLKKVLAEPPESQLAGVDASDLGGTQEGSPNMVPPMDDTAVDLTPEMIKRPALENLKAATSDPVPDLSRPAPAPTTELNPNADEGNGVLRPDSDFTDEENRTWLRITPEPAINSSPIGRRPPQPTPDTGSGTPKTGNERPGLQRLRQATADQPPKVGTSPAPSTEATSTAQMPNEQMGRLRNDSARDGAGPWSDSIDAGGDPVFDEHGNEQLNPNVRAGWRGAAARFKAAIEGGPTGDVSGMMDEDVNANLGLGGRTKGGLQGSSAYFPKRNADLAAQMANPDLAPPTQDAAANLRATSRTVDPLAGQDPQGLADAMGALPPEAQQQLLSVMKQTSPKMAADVEAILKPGAAEPPSDFLDTMTEVRKGAYVPSDPDATGAAKQLRGERAARGAISAGEKADALPADKDALLQSILEENGIADHDSAAADNAYRDWVSGGRVGPRPEANLGGMLDSFESAKDQRAPQSLLEAFERDARKVKGYRNLRPVLQALADALGVDELRLPADVVERHIAEDAQRNQ